MRTNRAQSIRSASRKDMQQVQDRHVHVHTQWSTRDYLSDPSSLLLRSLINNNISQCLGTLWVPFSTLWVPVGHPLGSLSLSIYIYIHTYIHRLYICIYIYIYIYIHTYIDTYINTHYRERDRQIDRQIDRYIDRQISRYLDIFGVFVLDGVSKTDPADRRVKRDPITKSLGHLKVVFQSLGDLCNF